MKDVEINNRTGLVLSLLVRVHVYMVQESSHIVAVAAFGHQWNPGPAHISPPSTGLVFSPLLMSFGSREVKILMGSTPCLWP